MINYTPIQNKSSKKKNSWGVYINIIPKGEKKVRGVILLDFKANYKVIVIKTHIISIKAYIYIHTHTHTHINVCVNLYMEQNKEAKNRSTYVWKTDSQQSCLGHSMENGFSFQNVTGIILISLWEKTDFKPNAKKKKKKSPNVKIKTLRVSGSRWWSRRTYTLVLLWEHQNSN